MDQTATPKRPSRLVRGYLWVTILASFVLIVLVIVASDSLRERILGTLPPLLIAAVSASLLIWKRKPQRGPERAVAAPQSVQSRLWSSVTLVLTLIATAEVYGFLADQVQLALVSTFFVALAGIQIASRIDRAGSPNGAIRVEGSGSTIS